MSLLPPPPSNYLSLPQYCFSFSNFSSYFSSLIRKPNLSLLQLIQIVINTVHLEDTNIYLENFISGEEGLFRKYIMTTHLHCICDRADGGGAGRHPRGEAPGQVHVQGHQSRGRGVHLQEAGNKYLVDGIYLSTDWGSSMNLYRISYYGKCCVKRK